MAIRIRYPNVGLSRALTATVVESDVELLRPGDHVEFQRDAGRTDTAEFRFEGNLYRVANLHFLPDEQDARSTLAEFELAD